MKRRDPAETGTRLRRLMGRGGWQAWLLGLLLVALAGVATALWWIDTPAGHRFLIARIAAMEPASGLRISVGSIDGSIYRRMTVRDLRLSDPKGRFATSGVAYLEWFPIAWLSNRLDIDRLHVPYVRIERLPALRPSERERRSILPGFDLRVGALSIDRIDLGEAVTGKARSLRVRGRADIRSGRAIVELDARALGGGDAIRLALDSRPDDNRFDIDALLLAPRDGIVTALAGMDKALVGRISGDGDWRLWKGRALLSVGGGRPSWLDIVQEKGGYRLSGAIERAALGSGGLVERFASPRVKVAAEGRMEDRLIAGDLRLSSSAALVRLTGGIDLGRSRYDDLIADVRPVGVANASSRDLVLRARLAGPFGRPSYDYLLRARSLQMARARIDGLRAEGRGRLDFAGVSVIPLDLRAGRVVVGSPAVEDVLRDISVEGMAQLRDGVLTTTPVVVRSAKLDGTLLATADFRRGSHDVRFAGDIRGMEIPKFGRVDISSQLQARSIRGAAFILDGRARAQMRRFDNAFLRGLARGLPQLTSDLALSGDGRLRFDNLRLSAPAIRLAARGYRDKDGNVHFAGQGNHETYGPLRLTLDGRIERPAVALLLDSPGASLAQVHVRLDPGAAGYAFAAEGDSLLGGFKGDGDILLPGDAAARIMVERLVASDAVAAGTLAVEEGGLVGTLDVTGAVKGSVGLAVMDGDQRIDAKLNLEQARFSGRPQLAVGRGRIEASAVLRPGATSLTATLNARGLRYGTVRLGRFAGAAQIVNGSGTVTATASNQRGRLFDLHLRAAVAPRRVEVDASGSIDRLPLGLTAPAVLTREEDGWRLAPATLRHRGGALRLSGLIGGDSTHLDAAMQRMPLALLDLVNSDLGLGGLASGTLAYDAPRGGAPTGRAEVRVRGLTRSGLALTSTPIDIGVNAELTASRAAMRAVIASGDGVIGRAQALMTPLGHGTLMERLSPAPLRAQLRYRGNADTLWRFSNFELFTLSGDALLSADVTGTLAEPVIRGSVAADNATLQSPVTGMTLTNVAARGRFDGSQLTLSRLEGRTRGGGTATGTGRISFSGERGIGLDLAARLDRVVVLDRDDIGATVTGPVAIRSDDSGGGTISGQFDVVSSRFQLGRAEAVAQIPELRVIATNRRGEEMETSRPVAPWRLAIQADARNRLNVTGLGMQSEWSADLDIGGTVTNPALGGTATLVRGDYDFAGRRFELVEGQLRFNGRAPIDPTLNIRAEADVGTVSASITISGTSSNPIVTFSSVPAMPDEELLSRLLFGTSITNLSAPEALQLAAAVAALQGKGGNGLDPINAIRRLAGLSRLRILPADLATGQGTSVAAGKNIGRSLYVELITDGQGYSATRVEYQITRWLSLLSTVSTLGRQSVNMRVSKDY